MILTVTDSPEGIRGDSANNVQKAATLETGISVQVPLFTIILEKTQSTSKPGSPAGPCKANRFDHFP